RQDSAATFFLAGQKSKALSQYERNGRLFQKAYKVEANNITESGEQQMANDIQRQYAVYRKAIEKLLYSNPPMPVSEAKANYFGTLDPAFLHLKQRAQDVLELNQAAIVKADADAEAEAVRASWTGVGVTVGAFLMALLAASRMIHSAL
ncbi:MAG: hypothetical protein M3Y56_07390, partial [Armatimonadota bacterium]|nr:hypothetical protein [Armatimonadota bacterium]